MYACDVFKCEAVTPASLMQGICQYLLIVNNAAILFRVISFVSNMWLNQWLLKQSAPYINNIRGVAKY
jgi:hypothetical protein